MNDTVFQELYDKNNSKNVKWHYVLCYKMNILKF